MSEFKSIGESLGTGLSEPSLTSKVETQTCPDCGQRFQAQIFYRGEVEVKLPTAICPACRRKQQELKEIERAQKDLERIREDQEDSWYAEYGVPGIFMEKTFENFQRQLQPKAFEAVKGYKEKSLVLLSPNLYGVGKTHLVCALANDLAGNSEKATLVPSSHLIRRHRCPVLFITEPKLLARIRRTFNKDAEESDEEVYQKLNRYPLLIIDDVGKVRPRDFSFLQGVYFQILDDRYNEGLPIILTTNLDFAELEAHIGGACADRLHEMCGKDGFVKMLGKSFRH